MQQHLLLSTFLFFFFSIQPSVDLTLIGPLNFADGFGRAAITLADMLKNDLHINFIPSRQGISLHDITQPVQAILKNPNKTPGKVCLLLDALWYTWQSPYTLMQPSSLKIAYSMIESTVLPKRWIEIINSHCDAVIVPDLALVPIYKTSGVTKPLFVVPCALYLEEFLRAPLKKHTSMPFVFGMTGGFSDRKNHLLLLEAFAQEFGNNPYVHLKLHSRGGEKSCIATFTKRLKELNLKNVTFTLSSYTRMQYLQFMGSLDCYVLLSKGEGFSITPREAMALGIPCILSRNLAHETLCDTQFVCQVPSFVLEPAYYKTLFGEQCGYYYNCTVKDARASLRHVYAHYQFYVAQAQQARAWVRKYSFSNLRRSYLSFIKPKKVILAKENRIERDFLMTDSQELYNKYKMLFPQPGTTYESI